jgi:hypothetical protein
MPCFKLLEDDQTLAFMDIYPANDGHCLVVAKDYYYPTLFEIRGICSRLAFREQSCAPGQRRAFTGRIEFGPGERTWRRTVGGALPYSRNTAQPGWRAEAELECKVQRPPDYR